MECNRRLFLWLLETTIAWYSMMLYYRCILDSLSSSLSVWILSLYSLSSISVLTKKEDIDLDRESIASSSLVFLPLYTPIHERLYSLHSQKKNGRNKKRRVQETNIFAKKSIVEQKEEEWPETDCLLLFSREKSCPRSCVSHSVSDFNSVSVTIPSSWSFFFLVDPPTDSSSSASVVFSSRVGNNNLQSGSSISHAFTTLILLQLQDNSVSIRLNSESPLFLGVKELLLKKSETHSL